jgi:polyhydroxyalkanoate synthase
MLQRNIDTLRFLAKDPVSSVKLGATPHEILHRQGPSALRYFAPAEAKHVPVFVSMPLINTWTIWDLLPGYSTVGKLVEAGVPVYLLDWGRPGPEDKDKPLSDYIDVLLGRAFDRARRHAAAHHGDGTLDAVGYCVGGTFLAAHLARHPEQARRAAFVCTPIDFHQSGRLATWANPDTFPLDAIVDGHGNFPATRMRDSFAWLRPAGITRKWFAVWDRIDQPEFLTMWAAMEKWNGDNVDFPGEAYREYVRKCYFENAMMTGSWTMAGRPVDLSKAKIPALAIAASDDHIVPPAAAFGLERAWGGPVTTKTIKGGHVAVSVTPQLPAALLEWVRS